MTMTEAVAAAVTMVAVGALTVRHRPRRSPTACVVPLSSVVGRLSSVVGRRSSVVGRRSSVVGRRSSVVASSARRLVSSHLEAMNYLVNGPSRRSFGPKRIQEGTSVTPRGQGKYSVQGTSYASRKGASQQLTNAKDQPRLCRPDRPP